MKLFLDTGSVAEVEEISAWGVLSGATTNASLLAQAGGDLGGTIARIGELVDGPVSVEVVAEDAAGMIAEGLALSALHEHVVVKMPFSPAGLTASRALGEQEIPVELALVFTASQALLAAEAGAALVSTSLSRLEDVSIDSGETLQSIIESLHTGETTAQVVAGGIRSPQQVVLAARLGAEVATVPATVLRRMLEHPLTAAGIERARADRQARPAFADWLGSLQDG
jgi:transaldolase